MSEAINLTLTSKELFTIYASGITALTAIISVVIAGIFNSYNQNKIIKGAVCREDKKLKIEKIEEIYDNYMFWENKVNYIITAIYAFQTGNMSFNDMREETIKSNNKMGDALTKAEMLVSLHLDIIHLTRLNELLKIQSEIAEFLFIEEVTKKNYCILETKNKEFEKATMLFKNGLSEEIKRILDIT